jgi:hypothetical protein
VFDCCSESVFRAQFAMYMFVIVTGSSFAICYGRCLKKDELRDKLKRTWGSSWDQTRRGSGSLLDVNTSRTIGSKNKLHVRSVNDLLSPYYASLFLHLWKSLSNIRCVLFTSPITSCRPRYILPTQMEMCNPLVCPRPALTPKCCFRPFSLLLSYPSQVCIALIRFVLRLKASCAAACILSTE